MFVCTSSYRLLLRKCWLHFCPFSYSTTKNIPITFTYTYYYIIQTYSASITIVARYKHMARKWNEEITTGQKTCWSKYKNMNAVLIWMHQCLSTFKWYKYAKNYCSSREANQALQICWDQFYQITFSCYLSPSKIQTDVGNDYIFWWGKGKLYNPNAHAAE